MISTVLAGIRLDKGSVKVTRYLGNACILPEVSDVDVLRDACRLHDTIRDVV